jgi:hypothetical protein
MQRLCRLTVPGLSIKSDFTAAHRTLLADFPNVHEVVATTAPGTLLVLYSGPDEANAWCNCCGGVGGLGAVTPRPSCSGAGPNRPSKTLQS